MHYKMRILVINLASVISQLTTKHMYVYVCPYKERAMWGVKSGGEFSVINYVKYVIVPSHKGLEFGMTCTLFNQKRLHF